MKDDQKILTPAEVLAQSEQADLLAVAIAVAAVNKALVELYSDKSEILLDEKLLGEKTSIRKRVEVIIEAAGWTVYYPTEGSTYRIYPKVERSSPRIN